MKHLWAPWRMAYIEGNSEERGCLFCSFLTPRDDRKDLILHRGRHTYVILNRYPYNNGHMMIVPHAHRRTLEELGDPSLVELIKLSSQAVSVLRVVLGAQAFNLGMNIGESAGAGVAEHVHMHVLPRWEGDTSFMATTAETRVLPEALDITYERLLEGWRALTDPG